MVKIDRHRLAVAGKDRPPLNRTEMLVPVGDLPDALEREDIAGPGPGLGGVTGLGAALGTGFCRVLGAEYGR